MWSAPHVGNYPEKEVSYCTGSLLEKTRFKIKEAGINNKIALCGKEAKVEGVSLIERNALVYTHN